MEKLDVLQSPELELNPRDQELFDILATVRENDMPILEFPPTEEWDISPAAEKDTPKSDH